MREKNSKREASHWVALKDELEKKVAELKKKRNRSTAQKKVTDEKHGKANCIKNYVERHMLRRYRKIDVRFCEAQFQGYAVRRLMKNGESQLERA